MNQGLSAESEIRLLYIVYWGAAEPLGRSLVLPALCRLGERGIAATLISFEKPSNLEHADEIDAIRQRLRQSSVRWMPLRYHKRAKWPATSFDILAGIARGLSAFWRSRFQIIHARTFVGGVMGLIVAKMVRAKLVYHNEGFYPDEQVDGGVWRAGSLPHRLAKALENLLYREADGIVVLSQRARTQVERQLAAGGRTPPICVVPSAVDLDLFRPRAPLAPEEPKRVRLVYIGSVGLRYLLDRVGRFVSVLARRRPATLRVLSGTPRDVVGVLLEKGGLPREAWSCDWIPHEQMPGELSKSHAGLFFLTQGLSEHGCSPTKFGEYWAAGLPVVTTPNVSDSEDIILRDRVGVVVREHSDPAYERAADELLELLADPELPRRCRQAAEKYYSLEQACRAQVDLYRSLTRGAAV